jgi:hypothetical protein
MSWNKQQLGILLLNTFYTIYLTEGAASLVNSIICFVFPLFFLSIL